MKENSFVLYSIRSSAILLRWVKHKEAQNKNSTKETWGQKKLSTGKKKLINFHVCNFHSSNNFCMTAGICALHTNKVSLACGVHAVQTDTIKRQLYTYRWRETDISVFKPIKLLCYWVVVFNIKCWSCYLLANHLTFLQQLPVDFKRCSCNGPAETRIILTKWSCLGRKTLSHSEFTVYLPRGRTLTLFLISLSRSTSLLRATAWLKKYVERGAHSWHEQHVI